jgi:hypothetical protein
LRSSHQAQIDVAPNVIGDGKGLDYRSVLRLSPF